MQEHEKCSGANQPAKLLDLFASFAEAAEVRLEIAARTAAG